MSTSYAETAQKAPLYARFLRFVIVGSFHLVMLYVKAVLGILKVGLGAIKKVPLGERERKQDV